MTKALRTTPKRKKRRTDKPSNEIVFYVVEIESWDWSFWFGVSNMPEYDGPYDDYRHLNIFGKVLRPQKYAGEQIRVSFLPNEHLNRGQREKSDPIAIGSIEARKGKMSAVVSMPADVLPALLTMATADQLRYIVMDGEKPRYGHGSLKSFRLDMTYDEDDLPADEA